MIIIYVVFKILNITILCFSTDGNNKRIKLDPIHQVEICLSNLPWEQSASNSIRNLKQLLIKYEKQQIGGTTLSCWDSIVEKSLAVFTALILSQGVSDTYKPSKLECHFANLLLLSSGNNDNNNDDITSFNKAVQKRIHQLLSPPLISELKPLHLLSIARLLSHIDETEMAVKNYIILPLGECSHLDITVWSKLLAVYVSGKSRKMKQNDTVITDIRKYLMETSQDPNITSFIQIVLINLSYYLSLSR